VDVEAAARLPECAARPKLEIERGAGLVCRTGHDVLHQPHLVKLHFPLGRSVQLELPDSQARVEFSEPMIVAPDVRQRVLRPDLCGTLFLEPETEGWNMRCFLRQLDVDYLPLPAPLVKELQASFGPDAKRSTPRQRLKRLRNSIVRARVWGTPEPVPPQVAAMLQHLHERAGENLDPSALEAKFDCSARQLSRRFRKVCGVTMRRYSNWLKVARGVGLAARGLPLNRAGEKAGFADAPHFTRSLRDHLGCSPSALPFDNAHLWTSFFGGIGELRAEA
jgi:AraC-like DNA-binding protein